MIVITKGAALGEKTYSSFVDKCFYSRCAINKLQPCFTSFTDTSLHEPLTDYKIVRAPLGTVPCVIQVHTLKVLTESVDTFFGAYCRFAHAEFKTAIRCQIPHSFAEILSPKLIDFRHFLSSLLFFSFFLSFSLRTDKNLLSN